LKSYARMLHIATAALSVADKVKKSTGEA
jgi:hypothetical protein